MPAELLAQQQQTRRLFLFVMVAIASISLLVGGIGIMNIMLASVMERTREIGVRRAVGATRKDVIRQFLVETTLITVSGGLAGVVVGIVLSQLVAYLAGWSTVVTVTSVVVACASRSRSALSLASIPRRAPRGSILSMPCTMSNAMGTSRFVSSSLFLVRSPRSLLAARASRRQAPLISPTPAPAAQTTPTGPALQLTMDRAVEMALESNLGLKSDRMTVEDREPAISSARSQFLPLLTTGLFRSSSRSVPNDFTQGRLDITSQGVNFRPGLSQTLPVLGTHTTSNWSTQP